MSNRRIDRLVFLAVLLGIAVLGAQAADRNLPYFASILDSQTVDATPNVTSDPLYLIDEHTGRQALDANITVTISGLTAANTVVMTVYGRMAQFVDSTEQGWVELGIGSTRTWTATTQPTSGAVYPVIFPVPMESLKFVFDSSEDGVTIAVNGGAN